MGQGLKNSLKSLLFLIVGAVILWLIFKNQSESYYLDCVEQGGEAENCSLLDKLFNDFSQVKWIWIIVVLLLFTISNWSRAERWKMLLEPLGVIPRLPNAFMAIMLGYFANLGIPRIGEIVRAGTLSRYEKFPLEKSVGTVVTDRLLDMISLLVVILIALIIEYDTVLGFLQENAQMEGIYQLFSLQNILILVLVVGLGLAGLIFLFKRKKNNPLVLKITNILGGFKDGILSVSKVKKPVPLILHSILIWTMYYLMTYFCFKAFDPTAELGAQAGFVTFVFGSLGMIVPLPGGMGSYHFCVMAALGLYGLSGADSFSFAMIIFFSIQIFCNVFLGLISLIYLPIYNRAN